jgi:hypothetical protein
LLGGELVELLNHGYIVRDDTDRLRPDLPWDDAYPYLATVHEIITTAKKPLTAKGLADVFVLSLLGKRYRQALQEMYDSLVGAECLYEFVAPGLLGEKTKYGPVPEAVNRVIEKVRAEVLEDGVPTQETLCLVALLDKTGLLRDFFSKFERGRLKERLSQMRASGEYAAVGEMVDYVDEMSAVIAFVMTANA